MGMGITEARAKQLLVAQRSIQSLDSELSPSKSSSRRTTLGDSVPSEERPDASLLEEQGLHAALQSVLSTLDIPEKLILRKRFGLESSGEAMATPMSLQQLGSLFNLSWERIRQSEENALRKLRVQSATLPRYLLQ